MGEGDKYTSSLTRLESYGHQLQGLWIVRLMAKAKDAMHTQRTNSSSA